MTCMVETVPSNSRRLVMTILEVSGSLVSQNSWNSLSHIFLMISWIC